MVGSKDIAPSGKPYTIGAFLYRQLFIKPSWPPAGTSLAGQTAIITGANQGLGLASAEMMLSHKLSHLIIAVRSLEKGEAAAATLRKQHGAAKIEVWKLDMSSYDSVTDFARRVDSAELPRLDMAVLNAGLWTEHLSIHAQTGHGEMLQVNYLATVLLAILLLPSLKSKSPPGKPGRLTISNAGLALQAKTPPQSMSTSSSASVFAPMDDPANFDFMNTYSLSKLLAHMALWRLVDDVPTSAVVLNLVDPGFVKGTRLVRHVGPLGEMLAAPIVSLIGRPPKVGASTYFDAVVSKGSESHGCFITNWTIQPFANSLYTPQGRKLTDQVWEQTLKELAFANVEGILKSMREGA